MIVHVSKFDLPTSISQSFLIRSRLKLLNSISTALNWITIDKLLDKYYSHDLILEDISSSQIIQSLVPESLLITQSYDYYIIKFNPNYTVKNSQVNLSQLIRMIDRGTSVNNPYGIILNIFNEYNDSISDLIDEYEFELMSNGDDT